MNKALLFLVVSLCAGCTASDADSRRALRSLGITKVQLTGWQPFGCGRGDDFNTGFKGLGVDGQPASGVVCCGLFKGCTVRF